MLVYGWKLVDYPEKLGPEGQFYSPIIWESVTIYFLTFVKYDVTLYGPFFIFRVITNSQNVHASIPEL